MVGENSGELVVQPWAELADHSGLFEVVEGEFVMGFHHSLVVDYRNGGFVVPKHDSYCNTFLGFALEQLSYCDPPCLLQFCIRISYLC